MLDCVAPEIEPSIGALPIAGARRGSSRYWCGSTTVFVTALNGFVLLNGRANGIAARASVGSYGRPLMKDVDRFVHEADPRRSGELRLFERTLLAAPDGFTSLVHGDAGVNRDPRITLLAAGAGCWRRGAMKSLSNWQRVVRDGAC